MSLNRQREKSGGSGRGRFLFFIAKASVASAAFLFVSFFCLTLASQPLNSSPLPKSAGTEIANNKSRTSAATEEDSVRSKSGIEKAFDNGRDVFEIWIFVLDKQSISKISVFNMLGKEMATFTQSNASTKDKTKGGTMYVFELNMSRFTTGMYMVAVDGTDFKDVERFVKSR